MARFDTTIRVIWIASLPRTGSMWTTNVVRELVRQSGAELVPPTILKTDRESLAYGNAHLADTAPGVAVLKTHAPPDIVSPSGRCIVTQRDIRDTLMSLMRFQQMEFDEIERTAPAYVQSSKADRFYPDVPERFVQHYTDIIASPAGAIRALADFLGIEADDAAIQGIATQYSKENVRQRIADVEKAIVARSQAGQPIDPADIVRMKGNRARAFDHQTGFQTGHVSDYQEGDWQHMLTEDQKARIDAAIRAAELNG